MATLYSVLMNTCGLSQREAADFHKVRIDTVKSWCTGRNRPRDSVIAELRALYEKIESAADNLIEIAAEQPDDTEIEIGYAADDAEAQSLGWPCVGAQLASIGIAAACIAQPVRLVPRGSTIATAAAADIHGL